MADRRGRTAAQLALAWVLTHGDNVVPIVGTRSLDRLAENALATEVGLSPDDLARLDRLFAPDAVAGSRYPESSMALLNG